MTETTYTAGGDTIVLTQREAEGSNRGEINLLVLDNSKSVGVQIELDAEAIEELKDALENLDV